MSLRAMGSIVAFALALPLALLAVRHRPTWVGLLASVPVLLFSIPTLAVMLWRRIEWILVGAPGLPPLRMESEGTPFGSVALPPFVIWPAWALAGLIEDSGVASADSHRPRRGRHPAHDPVGLAVGLAGDRRDGDRRRCPVALGAAPSPRLVPRPARSLAAARHRRRGCPGCWWWRWSCPRLTVVASLLYRVGLWRDTLRAWATDPLLGIGPGFMPYARQAAAPDFSFPVRQPHSHNLPLGVLGDAGLLGLGVAIVPGRHPCLGRRPWRMRTPTGRAAALVLVGLAVGGLTEDLTFLPNFNLLAILLVAVVLTDARAVRWAPLMARRLVIAAPAAAAGLALLVAMVVSDAGAVAHWIGLHEGAGRNWAPAVAWFERAEQLDPWHPTIPKSLAVVADADGDDALARRAAETAVARNSGDGSSWLNLALACETLGDRTCREAALERTVATGSFGGPETANAALGYDELGQAAPADSAFRRAILVQRLTTLAIDWPRTVADRRCHAAGGLRLDPRAQPAAGLVGDGRADRSGNDRRSGHARGGPCHAGRGGGGGRVAGTRDRRRAGRVDHLGAGDRAT